jgi:hypothetical protein
MSSETTQGRLSQVLHEVATVEAELRERKAELAEAYVQLSAFRLEYDTRVGRKVEELERVEAELACCRERIDWYRQWGPKGPPRTRSGSLHVPVEEQYRRTWVRPEKSTYRFDDSQATWGQGGGGRRHPDSSPGWYRRGLDPRGPPDEAQIKRLYRELCRRFHPDLTQDPAERAWRTEIMALVNEAYQARDLAELEALAVRDPHFPWGKASTPEQRLAALSEELAQLRQRLRQVKGEIRELIDGPAMRMSVEVKLAKRKGRDLLAELAADVERDLARRRAELEFMEAQLRQLGTDVHG